MIRLKSRKDIENLQRAGSILARVLNELESRIAPGVTGVELDERARKIMKEEDATPAFLGYGRPPFPAAMCISVNEAVVHGLPNDTPFQEGDIVTIDGGVVWNGMYVDSARTVPVGTVSDEASCLIETTKRALQEGIEATQFGNTTGDIGARIQRCVESDGYSVVRSLVGHGVGYAVHEDPQVPNIGRPGKGVRLMEGLVIAIEPMVAIGDPDIFTADDKWTVLTASGNLSAHEEHTVVVTHEGPKVLTKA